MIYNGIEIKEGMFVRIIGMEVKGDNDIFVLEHDYSIEGKYAVCKNEGCFRKVKLNGELSKAKYSIVFLNNKITCKNPNVDVKVVTDLKAAKKEVNAYLKNRNNKEVIVSFNKSNNDIKIGSYIKFNKTLVCGFFGDVVIGTRRIFRVKAVESKLQIVEVGVKGQEINTGKYYSFTEDLTKKIYSEEYISVYDKIETVREELTNKTEEIKEQSNSVKFEDREIKEAILEEKELNKTDITIKFNNEKNGIELYFKNKPSKETLHTLKVNGFRWSKYNSCWYIKDSEEARQFLRDLKLLKEDVEKEIKVSSVLEKNSNIEIQINDINNYKVSEELSKRENECHWIFRSEERNHTKELQNYLKSCKDSIVELINTTDNVYIKNDAINYLNSYMNKYSKLFIKIITNRADMPSPFVAGAGGYNFKRMNKNNDRYGKLLNEYTSLTEAFKDKLRSIKYSIKKEENKKTFEKIKEYEKIYVDIKLNKITVNFNPSAINDIFIGATNQTNAYKYNDYYIIKNWGKFTIYNNDGNEMYIDNIPCNCSTLKEAKLFLSYIVANKLKIAN